MSVDATALREKITEIALANPGFVYESEPTTGTCLYTHANGEPGCLVGHALAALGAQISFDDEHNYEQDVMDLWRNEYIDGNMRDIHWAYTAQGKQDSQYSWGEAVRMADEEFPPND